MKISQTTICDAIKKDVPALKEQKTKYFGEYIGKITEFYN